MYPIYWHTKHKCIPHLCCTSDHWWSWVPSFSLFCFMGNLFKFNMFKPFWDKCTAGSWWSHNDFEHNKGKLCAPYMTSVTEFQIFSTLYSMTNHFQVTGHFETTVLSGHIYKIYYYYLLIYQALSYTRFCHICGIDNSVSVSNLLHFDKPFS